MLNFNRLLVLDPKYSQVSKSTIRFLSANFVVDFATVSIQLLLQTETNYTNKHKTCGRRDASSGVLRANFTSKDWRPQEASLS